MLSSTVLKGHSKKQSLAVPEGISPIPATKTKSKTISPLHLFDKVSMNEPKDDENNTSPNESDKEKKKKKKKKEKKCKVAGFMT